MNDKRPDLPYEKAAEETAKTIGKGVDLVNRAAPALADVYGFLIGDRIAEQRARNADKMARETQRILHERNVEETRALPEDLAMPLLEAAQRDPREELLRIYATLAANAMDPGIEDHVRPEFVETIRQWQPIDVRVMQFADGRARGAPVFSPAEVQSHIPDARPNALELSFQHLLKLGCTRTHPNGGYTLTPYGHEIMRAVSENPKEKT
jgi:hypothetical protein